MANCKALTESAAKGSSSIRNEIMRGKFVTDIFFHHNLLFIDVCAVYQLAGPTIWNPLPINLTYSNLSFFSLDPQTPSQIFPLSLYSTISAIEAPSKIVTLDISARRSRSAAAYSDQTFPWTICRSVGASVCPCIVEERQIGSGYRLAS